MRMILETRGGSLCDPDHPMIDRANGGNLWVIPPREVWDRSELELDELIEWSVLIAASGRAMLEVLPQLKNGVINYWEAGNWSLNDHSEPKGAKKTGVAYKKVHVHLIGRSPSSTDPDWKWGEAPFFPTFEDHHQWWKHKENLTHQELKGVAEKARDILIQKYQVDATETHVLIR